jgi:DNA-binding LacI/PurR family transcriptional regulator
MGRLAVEILLDLTKGDKARDNGVGTRRVHLPVELVQGTTTAPAPAKSRKVQSV